MKVFCKEFITVWTRGLVRWLSRKFDSISIDLTPVEEKLDDVKSDVADVKTAVENIDFSTLAKEQTLTNALQSVLTALNPKATTNDVTTAKDAILEALSHISPEDPYSQALAAFFNLPQALPSGYHAMTEAEVLEIADEVWDAMYGFVAVPNTLHTVNARWQQVEIETYFNPSRTYGDYGFPELWAQNDQQQWVSILTDHPTANRVIYTFNPSND